MIAVKDEEKAGLSLLEEKISDALSLLLRLRNQVRLLRTLSDLIAPPSAQGEEILDVTNSIPDSAQTFIFSKSL